MLAQMAGVVMASATPPLGSAAQGTPGTAQGWWQRSQCGGESDPAPLGAPGWER